MAMSQKKKIGGLGRGLDALFQDSEEDASALTSGTKNKVTQELAIGDLVPGKYQPRRFFSEEKMEQLVSSIKTHGVLQPLFVRPIPNGKYEIVAGERRWRASQLAQLHTVPVVIRDVDDKTALEIALIENLQRQDLNPLEEAEGFKRLFDEFSYKQEDLATHLGKSRSHVANMMRLLKLPQPVQIMVREERLSAGHARALLSSTDIEQTAKLVIKNGFSVRETENYIQKQQNTDKKKNNKKTKTVKKGVDVIALERQISSMLEMPVSIDAIDNNPQHGKLSINYKTLDELDSILEKLSV